MKNKILYILIIILSGILVVVILNQKTQPSNAEIYSLKSDCSERSLVFAKENSKDLTSISENWGVLRSTYNIKRNSCFAEFGRYISSFFDEDYKDTDSRYIIDLLTGEVIASYNYIAKENASINTKTNLPKELLNEYDKSVITYKEKSEEIFGSVLDVDTNYLLNIIF